ncbi:MAG: sulfatase activating formylglycine-generating enzyme [Phycisphaerales bacterium]|jgi:formylglycine-generating enzyme required for sulfatase activity
MSNQDNEGQVNMLNRLMFIAATVAGSTTGFAQGDTETVRIPGTTVSFNMIETPAEGGGTLWVLDTEVTWDLYDVFVYQLDTPEEDEIPTDAVSRPSKPYVPPDRGFGHDGYPAMGMTLKAAREYCAWLSMKTGDSYRLPTVAEWQHFALAGSAPPYSFDEKATPDNELVDHAWTTENSNYTTHPVGEKQPNAFGLFDMHGNLAEWAETGEDPDARPRPKATAFGGSWRQPADEAAVDSFDKQASNWNASDPQIPKSQWWLADCSWVGFRFVREPSADEPQTQAPETRPPATPSDP